jgi:hypothetical protein
MCGKFAMIAYTVACARNHGDDEAELLVRVAEMSPVDVRQAELVLRPLGYLRVADMLRKIAGRRKNSLAPLR